MKLRKVFTVNLEAFLHGNAADRQNFIQNFGDSIRDFGFVILEGHEVGSPLIKKAYECAERFFAQPEEFKNSYDRPENAGQRGYTQFGKEHAKNQKKGDLKEFWHVGRETENNPELQQVYLPNLWPEESQVPGFRSTLSELYSRLDELALQLLEALSVYMHLEPDTFPDMARHGNSILRVLHYPALAEGDYKTGAVRAAAHEDINLITILCEATESGLEILTRENVWVPIESGPGQLVVDSGDMLSRVTNGLIPSTTHRVVNPPGARNSPRFSMPFFVHPFPSCDLTVLKQCTSAFLPPQYPPCSAEEFLQQRLAEIGLSKRKT